MKSTIAVLSATLAVTAWAQVPSTAPRSPGHNIVTAEAPRPTADQNNDDVEFLVDALRTDLGLVRIGELAGERGHDARVRAFGTKLKDDHGRQSAELERMLAPLNVTIPTEPSAEALSHHSALARLSGEPFDAAFIQTIIATHTEAVERYGAETHANPNRGLHDFAANGLEMLREHLAVAESLR